MQVMISRLEHQRGSSMLFVLVPGADLELSVLPNLQILHLIHQLSSQMGVPMMYITTLIPETLLVCLLVY